MAIILITGGTGLVGKALSQELLVAGHEVRILSRHPQSDSAIKQFYWNVDEKEIDENAFENIEHLVHLAGEGVADKRWAPERKAKIISSRVDSFKLVASVIIKKNIHLKSLIGASAIGFYGMQTTPAIFNETDLSYSDFLSEVCVKWENVYHSLLNHTNKLVVFRIGLVLAKNGGALKKMLPLFKLGLGSAFGDGKQYMPWIHLDDLVNTMGEALFNDQYNDTYNLVASEHVTNKEFSQQLAHACHKPLFMPSTPAFILKLVLGDMATILLTGSRVSNQKLRDTGYVFKYPTLDEALKACV